MLKKILVVDNQPVTLKLLAQLLQKRGYQVLTAESGLAALDFLKTETLDVVFTDLIMPHINGEKLCQIIRRIPKFKEVILVVFSAVAAEQKVDFTTFGANACIAKGPINEMSKHIFSLLDQFDQARSTSLPDWVIGIENIHPRQITKELLSVKRHFEVVLKSMAEGILETTPEGRIVYANPAAISLITIPEDKLLGSTLTALLPKKDRQSIEDLLISTETQPHLVIKDFPLMINSKQILLSLSPITDEKEKTVIVILNDVSERKRMEVQLLQAQKMEAIGTLAGGIAHDFNNLLMVIQGYVSLMLLEIASSHPHYQMLKNIENKVQSGSKLTSQLLGYARKGRYEVRPILLNSLIEETSEAFGRTRKEITIHRELADNLSLIEADQGQIEQVLMNLMVNAADAMPYGGDLFLRTANTRHEEMRSKVYVPKPGRYVMLSVSDTGIGMDAKTLEHIFEPFFTTKELGKGTGLGLASVYGIVKGHDGYIDVESRLGYGSTFKIYLLASDKKTPEKTRTVNDIVKGTGTILLVDDEDSVLDIGQRFLKFMDYEVLTARSGSEAIEIYQKYHTSIDLVILDMIMPKMGGGEVFDHLKKINPKVKVLLSSGYSINNEAAKILEKGCTFIQKPFDIKQLSQTIHEILKK
jgi:two-component system cell cycle sensor histidine kinase/response regulator CckA